MRSIRLLLPLILAISHIEGQESKVVTQLPDEVNRFGPVLHLNQKPAIVVSLSPHSSPSAEQNVSIRKTGVEGIGLQEPPVVTYESGNNSLAQTITETAMISQNNNLSSIDKRLGDYVSSNGQRGGRALKWSNFKLFSDKPMSVKRQKWGPSDPRRVTSLSQSIVRNNSFVGSLPNPMAMASTPHVVYSGHPPIHVFPQPFIIKEPEMAELSAASESFAALKTPNTNNFFDISASTSNKHEVSTSPPSTQFYAYGGKPVGSSDNSKSYGFRVKTRGNKHDTDYSSSTNYENYDDSYSPQHSDGSSDSNSDKFRPSTKYGHTLSSGSDRDSDRDYDKDYDRPIDYHGRDKSRDKYYKYASNQWLDWDADNGWLSSLLGYNRYPVRPRRPVAIGLMNSPTNEHLMFAASHPNPLELESLALMSPHVRPNSWMATMNPVRPTPSAIRPYYSFGGLMGYRRPPMAAPAPIYTRFNPGMVSAGSTMSPITMKQMGFVPPVMGLPSVAYPVRIPYSPLMMYGLRRPPIGHSGDLAFAESFRNTTNKAFKNWKNSGEDIQMSASQAQLSFALPPPKPQQNKPPIIVYQGFRPQVNVNKKSNTTVEPNDESLNPMPVFESLTQKSESVSEERTEDITTTTTENPYSRLFSTTEPMRLKPNSFESLDSRYRSEPKPYLLPSSANSGFSPRQSTADWVPVKQQVNSSQDGQQNR